MKNATAVRRSGYAMTMRVYTVTREGIIKADSGTREIQPARELPDVQNGYLPRDCLRYRAGQPAVTR